MILQRVRQAKVTDTLNASDFFDLKCKLLVGIIRLKNEKLEKQPGVKQRGRGWWYSQYFRMNEQFILLKKNEYHRKHFPL